MKIHLLKIIYDRKGIPIPPLEDSKLHIGRPPFMCVGDVLVEGLIKGRQHTVHGQAIVPEVVKESVRRERWKLANKLELAMEPMYDGEKKDGTITLESSEVENMMELVSSRFNTQVTGMTREYIENDEYTPYIARLVEKISDNGRETDSSVSMESADAPKD